MIVKTKEEIQRDIESLKERVDALEKAAAPDPRPTEQAASSGEPMQVRPAAKPDRTG